MESAVAVAEHPPVEERDYFTNEEIAAKLHITVKRLNNLIYAEGAEGPYPPYLGRGKWRRWPKALYQEWERAQALQNQPRIKKRIS